MGTNEVLKAVVAEFDAGELITMREQVSARVNKELLSRSSQFGLILDDISITHLTFGREFTAAVEQKQVAQQDAELLANAFAKAGEGLIELRRIEAAEDIANNMATSRGVVYLPQGQNTLLGLPQ